MLSCPHQVVLDDKDISVDDNTNSQESVDEVDEVREEGDEVTETLVTSRSDGGEVTDAESAVKQHHPVEEGLGGSDDDEVQEIAIGDDDQYGTNSRS